MNKNYVIIMIITILFLRLLPIVTQILRGYFNDTGASEIITNQTKINSTWLETRTCPVPGNAIIPVVKFVDDDDKIFQIFVKFI